MNKNKKSLPIQVRKKQAKVIKKAEQDYAQAEEVLERTDKLKVKEALKKLPPKPRKAKTALVESVVKGMEAKKKKKKGVSKRTTPSELDLHESPRAYSHREGERWEKTLVKQNVGKAKSLVAKMAKRASKSPAAKRKK
jgi:hypothetical protein